MKTKELTPQEKKALIRVRDGLRSGKFVHRKNPYDTAPSKKPLFNMGTVGLFHQWDCGSIGCIGGWVEKELRRKGFAHQKGNKLCYPIELRDWVGVTPAQAAKAIDNFLKDGDPRWKTVTRRAR